MAFRDSFERHAPRTTSKSAAMGDTRTLSRPGVERSASKVTAMRALSRPNATTPLLDTSERTVSSTNLFAPGGPVRAVYTPADDNPTDETKLTTSDSSVDNDLNQEPHWSEYQPHYPCLYKFTFGGTVIFGAVPAFLGEGTFGLFSYKYAALGTKMAINALGGNADHIVADVFSEAVGYSACVSEIINGVTQFELEEVPKTAQSVDTLVHDMAQNGLGASLCNFARNNFSSCTTSLKTIFYTVPSYGLFFLASAATSYGDIEDVKDRAQDWFGEYGGNVALAWLGGGAMFYCVKSFLDGTQKGMQFLMEPTFRERYQNHHNPLIEAQYIIEGGTAISYRVFALSFLFGRFAEQWGLDASLFYTLGGAAGLAQGMQFFLPKSHSKIHLYVDEFPEGDEPKPVTQAERDIAYKDKYEDMNKCKRAWIEFKRAFMIGIAQSGVTLYFLLNEVMPVIVDAIKNDDRFIKDKDLREAIGYGVFMLVGVSATTLAYAPHWCANVYAECNEIAYKRRDTTALESIIVKEIEDKAKESRCARYTGIGASLLSQVTRVPALVASLVNNKKIGPFLSKPHWTILSGGIGTLVGYNRYNRMTESSIKGIHSFNNFVTSIPGIVKGKVRGWCCPKVQAKTSQAGMFGGKTDLVSTSPTISNSRSRKRGS